MGLSNYLGHQKEKAVIWFLVNEGGFGGDIWERKETDCEYVQKQMLTTNTQGASVTSFAQYVINEFIDLRVYSKVLIKLKDSNDLITDTEPNTFCFNVVSVNASKGVLETVPSEWVVHVGS